MSSNDGYESDSLNAYKEIVFRCWSDPAFKQKFLSDPKGVLKDFGVELRDSIQSISIVENNDSTLNLVLPFPPDSENCSEEQLKERLDAVLLEQFVFPTVLI